MKSKGTVLAIPADTHCGGITGLMLSRPWNLTEGGTYHPTWMQGQIAEQWDECWMQVKEKRKGKRLIVIHAGDAIEGVHHGTKQLVTWHKDEQARIHIDAMEHGLNLAGFNEKKGDLLFYLLGTETHNGTKEDGIARDLGAIPFIKPTQEDGKDGTFVWREIKKTIAEIPFDIAHHGVTPGTRQWTKGNVVRSVLASMYLECLEENLKLPRYWIRAHRHTWIEPQRYSGNNGTVEGFLLPCFQAPTKFVDKIKSWNLVTNIGMLYFDLPNEWHCPRIKVKQPQSDYEAI